MSPDQSCNTQVVHLIRSNSGYTFMRITKRWETTEENVRAGPLCLKIINEIAPTYPSTIQMEKHSLRILAT